MALKPPASSRLVLQDMPVDMFNHVRMAFMHLA